MRRRYGIHARVEDEAFVVERVEDPMRLPPVPGENGAMIGTGLGSEAEAAAVKAVMDRLSLKLAVIEKTGFVSYFLIVADFVRHGRSIGVSCVARGSAAGSLVTYLLEIANVDPIRYGLLFERFLNPERVNPLEITRSRDRLLQRARAAVVQERACWRPRPTAARSSSLLPRE